MCGIAGFVGPWGDQAATHALLARMIGTLAHRGPDGSGIHLEPGVGLAHARLAIIDPEGGRQPLANARGTVWVSFNGEIFNHPELRARLEAQGHRFATRSDTEIIVHLYERYGDAFVEHLNGQFALALWDRAARRLVLARDRAGIRPLFLARSGGRLLFASETKALWPALGGAPALDIDALAQVFTYWSPLEPGTVHRGVWQLPPGHLLAIEADGRERMTRYWDWTFPQRGDPPPDLPEDPQAAARALRTLLADAVALQLRADVPVGAYLSGGLDSSGIVALARRQLEQPLRTFSLAFEDAEFDESEHQQAMVRFLGTRHSTVTCRRGDIAAAFPRFVRHAETPVLRTAAVPLMLLAGAVRADGCKVVLTGEGADEVFAGYDLFKEAKVRRFWARQPDSAMRPRLLGRLYPYLRNSPVGNAFSSGFFGAGLEQAARPAFAHIPRWTTSARALAFFAPEHRQRLRAHDAVAAWEATLPAASTGWEPLARDQYIEAKSLLAGYLLSSQGDRAAMANSVEARFPYLDHRVIEFANALPARWKLRGLTEKAVLRDALAGLLPQAIARRGKQPYRAPDSQSFFIDGKPVDYVAELLSPAAIRQAGYFDPTAVTALLDKCRAGRATGFGDNQAFVGILSTMLLHAQGAESAVVPAPATAGASVG